MTRRRLLPRYVKWRDGRPRWELGGTGGKRLIEAGFKSIDLKDPDNNWLTFEAAKEAGKRINGAVDQWRAQGGPLEQADLEAMLSDLQPTERGSMADFAHLMRGPVLQAARLNTFDELDEAYRRSPEWRSGIKPKTRQVYSARSSVLRLWIGDLTPGQIKPSAARRWFESLLDVGFERTRSSDQCPGNGWHKRVLGMNRPAREALREARLRAMEEDDELAARPPGYGAAYYTLAYAGSLIAWANRARDAGLPNNFRSLGLSTPKGRIRYVEAAELAHIVATADRMGRTAVGDAAALAVNTVQRRSDLCRLSWTLHREKRFFIAQQKTGEEINCRLSNALLRRLDSAWERATAEGVLPAPDQPILPYPNPDVLTAHWREVRTEAAKTMPSVADVMLHDLRDTGFTRLIESGNSLIAACQVSGHSVKRATTIEKAYLARRRGIADGAIDKMDAWMDEQGVNL